MTDSRKRPKLSSEEVDEKPFLNHQTLYFDDGNIILRTEWTLFCVHRSLLTKHSPVFANILQRQNLERFRGLTQITMNETREDLEALLNVIYDGLRIDVEDLTVETFPALATILRMASKYKIERPCQDIISRIRAQWPPTLAQHDTREVQFRATLLAAQVPVPAPQANHGNASAQAGPSNWNHGGVRAPNIDASAIPGPASRPTAGTSTTTVKEDLIVHPASVIALLRECGYDDASLLFPLFYALSRTTWQFGGPALGHHIAPLSVADMERFVVGIERLRSTHTSLAVSVPPFAPVPGSAHFCLAGAQELWSSLARTLLVTNGVQRALEPLEDWLSVIALVSAQRSQLICADCTRVVVAKINTYRQTVWTSLPRFFELV